MGGTQLADDFHFFPHHLIIRVICYLTMKAVSRTIFAFAFELGRPGKHVVVCGVFAKVAPNHIYKYSICKQVYI